MNYLVRSFKNHASGRKGIFSDFDGTLANIRSDPSKVTINSKCKQALSILQDKYIVGVVSGRPVSDLLKFMDLPGIYYLGNHGAQIYKDEKLYTFPEARKASLSIKKITSELSERLNRPFFIESKKYSASVHYRIHPYPQEARKQLSGLLSSFSNEKLIEIKEGRKIFEIRIKGINKAVALNKILQDEKISNFLYFGDDMNDLGVFKLRKEGQINIAIKNKEVEKIFYEYADLMIEQQEVADILNYLSKTNRSDL